MRQVRNSVLIPKAVPEALLVFLALPSGFKGPHELLPVACLAAIRIELVDHTLRRLLGNDLNLEYLQGGALQRCLAYE